MIGIKDFHRVMRLLDKAYPRFEMDEETVEVYYQVLCDLPLDLLKAAVLDWIGDDTPWCPSAGQVRARAFSLLERKQGTPTAGEAWAEALKRVDYYDPPKEEGFSHPLVKRALDAIGGNRVLCMTMDDALHTARARFIQAYEALLARERRDVRMLPQVRKAITALTAGFSGEEIADGTAPELENGGDDDGK